MKQYNFLLKPLFFIFCLLFSAWLVIKIEKISPSDFGEDSHDITKQVVHSDVLLDNKQYLNALCIAFKGGKMDSIELNKSLTLFLEFSKNSSGKEH